MDLRVIKKCLHQMILDQDQIQEIILSLWENSAVLTKAAQQLYLHRNSLQYKIDKWEELTGLQLKELTDFDIVLSIDFTRYSTKVFVQVAQNFFYFFWSPCHRKIKRFSYIIKTIKRQKEFTSW